MDSIRILTQLFLQKGVIPDFELQKIMRTLGIPTSVDDCMSDLCQRLRPYDFDVRSVILKGIQYYGLILTVCNIINCIT